MRYLPLEWLPAFHASIAGEIARGRRVPARDALAVALGLHGLRVGEVCGLLRSDLDVVGGRLYVRTLKGGSARSVPVSRSVADALASWSEGRPGAFLLSTSFGCKVHASQFQRACRRLTAASLGVSFRFHSLRHTFAMQLYSVTRDLLLVKRLLGHRSVEATEIYAEALDDVPGEVLLDLDSCRFYGKATSLQLRIFEAG